MIIKSFLTSRKSFMLPAFAALAMFSMVFASCGDDEEENMGGPSMENTKSYTINGKKYDVKSVGYYFNDTYGNFSILFTAENLDLSRQLSTAPKLPYLKINIPNEKCNMTCDLTQSLNSSYAIFYVQTNEGSFADFTSGKIYISIRSNKIKALLTGQAEKGPKLELQYEGSVVRSEKEIW